MQLGVFFIYIVLFSILYLFHRNKYKKIYHLFYTIFLAILGIFLFYLLQKDNRLGISEISIIVILFSFLEYVISYFLFKIVSLKSNYFFYLLSFVISSLIGIMILSFIIILLGIVFNVNGL